jgi:hypothetical protein
MLFFNIRSTLILLFTLFYVFTLAQTYDDPEEGAGLPPGGPEWPEPQGIDRGSLEMLSESAPLYSGTGNNCIMTDFNVPGQGYRLSGSTGGLLDASSSVSGIEPQKIGNGIASQFSNFNSDVMIFVLDDFVTPNPLPNNSSFSHGDLVMYHINQVIEGTQQFMIDKMPNDTDDPDSPMVIWKKGDKSLTVQGVNVINDSEFTTETAGAFLEDMLPIYERVVVNMSWVILPCNTLQDFLESREQFSGFQEYLDSLKNHNQKRVNSLNNLSLEAIFDHFVYPDIVEGTDPFTGNRLLDSIINFSGSSPDNMAVFVGSAGNFGLKYPMFPAALSEVFSVMASEGLQRESLDWSNNGEITDEVGAWFTFTPTGTALDFGIEGSFSYGGTSFSAPNYSVRRALQLGQ